jgi:adenosylhomocysteine nucleosidase
VTVVVAAMPEELAALRGRLGEVTRITTRGPGALDAVGGRIGPHKVVVAVTGDGERNAREGAARLLEAVRAERLIAMGVAGGLSSDLRACELVLAERVVVEGKGTGDVVREEQATQATIDHALRAISARRGVVVTATRIADTVAEKQRLLHLAAAGPLCAVVDLESASYVAAAVRADVPWLVLRAVSDTADEPLPALLNRSRDAGGAVRRSGVVRGLFGDPGALPALLSLRRRLRHCADELARAAVALLSVPTPAYAPGERPDTQSSSGALR